MSSLSPVGCSSHLSNSPERSPATRLQNLTSTHRAEAGFIEVYGQSPPRASTPASWRDSSPFSRQSSRSMSRGRRVSFDSVNEDKTDIPQSFANSTNTSFSATEVQNFNPGKMAVQVLSPPALAEFCSPCTAFEGWKQIRLGGKRQTKSYSDIRALLGSENGWTWRIFLQDEKPSIKSSPEPPTYVIGLDSMPFEILDLILAFLVDSISPDSFAQRNADLISCLMTSRTLHAATLSTLYRNVTIPHSSTFSKFLNHICQYPSLGTLVRRLDFSRYNSIGFGRTRRASSEIHNVTPDRLEQCLGLMPNLKEFEVHEHIDDELSQDVLHKLFSMQTLRGIDFCACSSKAFVGAFTATVTLNVHMAASLPFLKRLSLHECSTLQAPVFESMLPRLTSLTHLDVSHTLITNEALLSLPQTARLTHLNLGKCTRITGASVVRFLTTHEAVKDSLVFLNVMADASRYRLLYEEDVEALIPALPTTLRSLNLGGAQLTGSHIPLLLSLTKFLEELNLSYTSISVSDINSLFMPRSVTASVDPGDDSSMTTMTTTATVESLEEEFQKWIPSNLRYLDLTGVAAVTQPTLMHPSCLLVSPHSWPLEVIELGEGVLESFKQMEKRSRRGSGRGGCCSGKPDTNTNNTGIGWAVRELGRRGWLVREQQRRRPQTAGGNERDMTTTTTVKVSDDGRRGWKMGARWWGMRKVPVAVQEVGGMYGHYMFKN